jgi:Na+/melibiose symporter-like transporter
VYLAGAVVFIIMPTNLAAGLFFCMTIGAADQLSLIVIKINRANISDTIEIQQHKRMDNMISNASSFMIRCAGALLALVFGWILEFSGYNAELSVQPHSAEVGLIAIMGGSALLFAGMLLLSTFRMKIDKELESVEKPE